MNPVIENLAVAAAVLLACWMAFGHLAPRLRTRLMRHLSLPARRAALAGGQDANDDCGGGCSTCGACASATADAVPGPSRRVITVHLRR